MRALAVLAISLLIASGCHFSDTAPGLLGALSFSPRGADVGDRLEVVGSGFPRGKSATVTFRGDLHRPGRVPERDVEITAAATAVAHDRVSVLLDEALQARFCGIGDRALHTTFRGEVELAFAPRTPAAPPVTGTVPVVTLDVLPPAISEAQLELRHKEASNAMAWLGASFRTNPRGAGLLVEAVRGGSPAEAAGIRKDDVLLELDGVVLHSELDAIPARGERWSTFLIRRGNAREPLPLRVEVGGLHAAAAAELLRPALLLLAVLLPLLLLRMPPARWLAWLARRFSQRLHGSAPDLARGKLAGSAVAAVERVLGQEMIPFGPSHALPRLIPYLLFVAVSAGFTIVAFGKPLIAEDLDLPLMYLASTTALLCTSTVLGGFQEQRGWSLRAGLRAGGLLGIHLLPALLALATLVATNGSVRLSEVVLSQGPFPWEWYAFRSPLLLIAYGLFLLPAVVEWSSPVAPLAEAVTDGAALRFSHPAARCLAFFAEWGNVFVTSGLSAVLFLGGWQAPAGLTRGHGPMSAELVGALALGMKAWATLGVILLLRFVLPRLSIHQTFGVCVRWCLPVGFLGLGLTLVWLRFGHAALSEPLHTVMAGCLFACVMAAIAYAGVRVRRSLRTGPVAGLNPWI